MDMAQLKIIGCAINSNSNSPELTSSLIQAKVYKLTCLVNDKNDSILRGTAYDGLIPELHKLKEAASCKRVMSSPVRQGTRALKDRRQ